ncbi:hypothetical protein LZ31DRAFT_63483 [Colletotrichum somersetense]|nr:hypothetical protein LZ31DRAFT_63483 [Colletotrichum somersetense]
MNACVPPRRSPVPGGRAGRGSPTDNLQSASHRESRHLINYTFSTCLVNSSYLQEQTCPCVCVFTSISPIYQSVCTYIHVGSGQEAAIPALSHPATFIRSCFISFLHRYLRLMCSTIRSSTLLRKTLPAASRPHTSILVRASHRDVDPNQKHHQHSSPSTHVCHNLTPSPASLAPTIVSIREAICAIGILAFTRVLPLHPQSISRSDLATACFRLSVARQSWLHLLLSTVST